MIHAFGPSTPRVHPTAFVHDSAHVIGDVEIGEDASVWVCAVIRGDVNYVRIGRGTNIQDGTVIHVNRRGQPTILEEFVTVGHAARLHGCRIVLDGAELGEDCLVAAGTLVPPGMKVPPRSLLMGSPATIRREIDADDLDLIRRSATGYVQLKDEYLVDARRGR